MSKRIKETVSEIKTKVFHNHTLIDYGENNCSIEDLKKKLFDTKFNCKIDIPIIEDVPEPIIKNTKSVKKKIVIKDELAQTFSDDEISFFMTNEYDLVRPTGRGYKKLLLKNKEITTSISEKIEAIRIKYQLKTLKELDKTITINVEEDVETIVKPVVKPVTHMFEPREIPSLKIADPYWISPKIQEQKAVELDYKYVPFQIEIKPNDDPVLIFPNKAVIDRERLNDVLDWDRKIHEKNKLLLEKYNKLEDLFLEYRYVDEPSLGLPAVALKLVDIKNTKAILPVEGHRTFKKGKHVKLLTYHLYQFRNNKI